MEKKKKKRNGEKKKKEKKPEKPASRRCLGIRFQRVSSPFVRQTDVCTYNTCVVYAAHDQYLIVVARAVESLNTTRAPSHLPRMTCRLPRRQYTGRLQGVTF